MFKQSTHRRRVFLSRDPKTTHYLSCSLFLVFFFFAGHWVSLAQTAPKLEWERLYGGYSQGRFSDLLELEDGYIMSGTSYLPPGTAKPPRYYGGHDIWIIKTDKNGNKLWDKCFGGSGNESVSKVIKTNDNNLLIVGSSNSPISGNKSSSHRGGGDFWIVKINNSGEKIWDKSFGGSSADYLSDVLETHDGFILAGNSASPKGGDKSEANYFNADDQSMDYWVAKIDKSGKKILDKTFDGGNGSLDYLSSVKTTTDGRILLAGYRIYPSGVGYDPDQPLYPDSLEEIWVLKVNQQLVSEGDFYKGGEGEISDFIQAPNRKYIAIGKYFHPEQWQRHLKCVVFSENGEVEHTISRPVGYSTINSALPFSITADANGFYISGERVDEDEAFTEKYNWNNELQWRMSYAGKSILVSSNGELLIGGHKCNYCHFWESGNGDFVLAKTESPSRPFSKFYYGGVNLNSSEPQTMIDGYLYLGDKFFPNFTFTGKKYSNQSIPLINETNDVEKDKMIRSVVYSTKAEPASFNFTGLPLGEYELYFYVWEDNRPATFSVSLQKQPVLYNINSGPKGSWAKVGPIRVNASVGEINMNVYGGDGNIGGIELWKVVNGQLERAVNFNSSQRLTIDGDYFQPGKSATGFTFTGKTYENQTIQLSPRTDYYAERMIRSSIYSTKSLPARITIDTESNEDYEVYLYTWEDNFTSTMSIHINNNMVINGTTGVKGEWRILGPYKVRPIDKKIIITASNGDVNLSGIRIYKVNTTDPSVALRLATDEEVIALEQEEAISVFPNPAAGNIGFRLADHYTGKVKISILDNMGISVLEKVDGLQGQKQHSIDLTSIKPGLYVLRLQYGEKTVVKRIEKK